jgi:hypothetical protein
MYRTYQTVRFYHIHEHLRSVIPGAVRICEGERIPALPSVGCVLEIASNAPRLVDFHTKGLSTQVAIQRASVFTDDPTVAGTGLQTSKSAGKVCLKLRATVSQITGECQYHINQTWRA